MTEVTAKTLADALASWQQKQLNEQADIAKHQEDNGQRLSKALANIGLTPSSIKDGCIAIFDHEGEEVRFLCWKSDGAWAMERLGTCTDCGATLKSPVRWGMSLENFGELLDKPHWEYGVHICPNKPPKNNPYDRLVSALNEILGLDNLRGEL